jgi:hypothetical protein
LGRNFATFTLGLMRIRRKIAPFIFGVTIGLLVGVGFFIFQINDWFSRLKANSGERITVIQQPVKNVVQEEVKKKETRERFKINFGKSKKVNYREVDSLIKDDTDIKIATDELLTVKNVKAIHVGDNVTENDSAAALAKVSQPEEDLFFIEFWKTPLNSKGYRFLKNKIMLYGFLDFNVILYRLDNSFYIKSSDQVYRIFYGGEFRPLERVVDSELLAKLN